MLLFQIYLVFLFIFYMDQFFCQYLNPVVYWPSREKIQKHMPFCFKLKYPNTTVIIDCAEFFIQKPRNSGAQSATWSNYKLITHLKH